MESTVSMEATDAPVSMVATRITREGPEEEVKKSLSRRRPQPKQLDESMRGRKEAGEQKVARKHMRAGKLAQLREQSEREEVFREKSRREEELREQSKREEVLREQSKREEDVLWKREEVRREENESGVLEGLSGGGDKEPVTGGQVNQGASEQKRRESEEQDYLQVGQTANLVSVTQAVWLVTKNAPQEQEYHLAWGKQTNSSKGRSSSFIGCDSTHKIPELWAVVLC
jgi:hypothetical protein